MKKYQLKKENISFSELADQDQKHIFGIIKIYFWACYFTKPDVQEKCFSYYRNSPGTVQQTLDILVNKGIIVCVG